MNRGLPDRLTGAELWERYFYVRMNYLHSRSVDHVRRYGVRVSGVEEIDRMLPEQEILTQLTIDAMFEKHRSGVTIKVVNYEDTAEIYRIIRAHLLAWVNYLATGINIGDAPIEDLIALDAFAKTVYEKAVDVFSIEDRALAVAQNFRNVQSLNFGNILKRSQGDELQVTRTQDGIEVVRINNDEVVVPQHQSLKTVFQEQLTHLGGWQNYER